MSSPHDDPAANGQRFGDVIVTVDPVAGDCVVTAPRRGPVHPVTRSFRLHGLEEIQGAYQVQHGLAATDPVAADIARALEFAAQQLQTKGG